MTANPIQLVESARSGVLSQQAAELAKKLDLTDREMAQLLAVSVRTYHRQKQEERLNPVASERLLLLNELAEHGYQVFENQANFNHWLRRPLRELASHSPLDWLDTATGIGLVDAVLGRIEYGVYS